MVMKTLTLCQASSLTILGGKGEVSRNGSSCPCQVGSISSGLLTRERVAGMSVLPPYSAFSDARLAEGGGPLVWQSHQGGSLSSQLSLCGWEWGWGGTTDFFFFKAVCLQ